MFHFVWVDNWQESVDVVKIVNVDRQQTIYETRGSGDSVNLNSKQKHNCMLVGGWIRILEERRYDPRQGEGALVSLTEHSCTDPTHQKNSFRS